MINLILVCQSPTDAALEFLSKLFPFLNIEFVDYSLLLSIKKGFLLQSLTVLHCPFLCGLVSIAYV